MWSQLILCLLVGLASASQNPAWKQNTKYYYQVRARTVSSLNQISSYYNGIALKAELYVSPMPDGNLNARIANPEYAEIDDSLEDGWNTRISDNELHYQPLPISNKPFQLIMEGTAIRNLVVDGSISNWEANVIKSIVSQLQLDTQGNNLIESHYNLQPQENSEMHSAVFKTMEETVTGVSETLYEIHPLPKYVLQTSPWLVPLSDLHEDEEVIEVMKTKNFTHSPVYPLPSYHFGVQGINRFEPENKIADFSSRTAETRAVITGDLNRYTIQSVITVDEIYLSPTMMDKQKGSVKTMLNVTLKAVQQTPDPYVQPSNPVKATLVYRYNNPFSNSNNVREGVEVNHDNVPDSSEAQDYDSESLARRRLARSQARDSLSSSFSSEYEGPYESLKQEQPKLNEPPKSPLLPFTVGYDGQAFNNKKDVVPIARQLTQQMAEEIQHPEQIPSKNTVGKFLMLTNLLRLMKPEEMKQLGDELYSEQKRTAEAYAWQIYRDAVAEAGTGPSFLTIRSWIKNGKIENEIAARVLQTNVYSTRQPTEEYMTEFFSTIIRDEQIMAQPTLNETALLAYTQLVHQVCVHKNVSHSKYPVHSFGYFCTQKAEQLVINQVIPYLSQELKQAVSEADTQQIHVYIRALGNVGHQRILEAFEPYLEGKEQMSQYQRLLIVVALDRLVRSNPRVARSVLYKIYQNPTEQEQVRVAAVFQLMRTNPPASMLQRMAVYTNFDSNNYVNAAVKSSIESASQLQGRQHYHLRSAAHSAKQLLTPHRYGPQYSYQNISHYVVDQMHLGYHQQIDIFGGEDSFLPKGFRYSLHGKFGSFARQLVTKEAIVSSIEDLMDVFHQQTKHYKDQQQLKQSQPQDSWSSETVAQILNMDIEQREQLEGYLYKQIGHLQYIWSFDNHTINRLPREIQEWEEKLKNGESYDYSQMIVAQETAFSFPTGLGLPFIYTYDTPIVIKYEADVKAVANPSISNGEALRKPNSVEVELEVRAVLSGRTQTQFGFFTPHNSKRYSSGYDKNFQVVLPVSAKMSWDVEEEQVSMEFKNSKQEDIPLLHYSTWPYTASYDIYSLNPKKTVIQRQDPYQIHQVIGKKSMGIAFNVEAKSDKRIDLISVYEKLFQYDPLTELLASWPSDEIQYSEMNLTIDQQESRSKKVVINVGYKQQYQSGKDQEQNKCEQNFPEDPVQRQEESIRRVAAGIKSADAHVVDATITFEDQQGQPQVKYIATVAGAKSNVDPKSSFLALFKQITNQEQPLRFCVESKSKFPNTNGLNLEHAMNMDTTSTVEIRASLTGTKQGQSNIQVKAQFSKSEERLQYLREQQQYKECQRQMQEGNNQLSICARATARANLLDQFQINVESENVDPRIVNYTYKAYSILRHRLYPRFQESIVSVHPSDNNQRISIQGRFSPDLSSVHAYVDSPYGAVEVKNVQLSEWAKYLLVPHPVFHTRSRMIGYVFKYDIYRPICVIDKNAASTFDNTTYPVKLGQDWTVLLQYVPRRPAQQGLKSKSLVNDASEYLKNQPESYIVYVRSDKGSSQKEVKIVVQSSGTDQRTVKINLRPAGSGHLPKLYIEDKEVTYNDQESTDIHNGYIQVYGLPNNEVKVEVQDAFYVIYDGERAKLTVSNGKFRDASRGLCGTFTGEPKTDFENPEKCILKSPQQLVQSYSVQSQNNQPIRRKSNYREEHCYKKQVEYVNVISDQDKGITDHSMLRNMMESTNQLPHKYSGSSCTKMQTKYMIEGGEICFTLRPLPSCKPGCNQEGTSSKDVSVHCVQQSNATHLWKKQIDRGASPDFSQKSETRTIKMRVPKRCLA